LLLGLGMIGKRSSPASAGVNPDNTGVNPDNSVSDNCQDHFQFDQGPFAKVLSSEEKRMLPNQTWSITEQNGGMLVTTWDQPEFSVKLCKMVASHSDKYGQQILNETRLTVQGPSVVVDAPPAQNDFRLGTFLLVKTPKSANVKIKLMNGGARLHRFLGNTEVTVLNGGLSLDQSNGKISIEVQNGGVTLTECGGDIAARVQNGGVTLNLQERWEGKGLETSIQVGGLIIAVPQQFSSGLEISSATNYNLMCHGKICQNLSQTRQGNGRWTFRLGSGNPQIRATIDNGGITIKDRESNQ
jgi:hypothetical protein